MKAIFPLHVLKYFWKWAISNQTKTTKHRKWFTPSCPKEKGTLKENYKEKYIIIRHKESKCCNSLISKKINLKLFIYNAEHKSS